MIWKEHSNLEGEHAVLSPSKYHWIFDTDEEFEKRLCAMYAPVVGTLLHEKARDYIKCGKRMSKADKRSVVVHLLVNHVPQKVIDNLDLDAVFDNLTTYVCDSVFYKMVPEKKLYFSEKCFGTADAISYDEKDRILRINDLKTGTTPAKIEQLYIYTALFFLDYSYIKLSDSKIELRIYQNNSIILEEPDVDIILPIMETIKNRHNFIVNFED